MIHSGTALRAPSGAHLKADAARLAAKFAQGASQRDLERSLPYPEIDELRAAGLLAASVPADFNGPGATYSDIAEIFITLASGDPNIAQAIQPHFCIVETLRIFGTQAQRDFYFGRVLDGDFLANALAERGGRFIGDIVTTLRRAGDYYALTGSKFYSTGSLFAQYLYVTCRTENGDLATVIVPKDRQGVRVVDDWAGMGQRTTGSGTTTLDNVTVHAGEIIGKPAPKPPRTYFGAFAQMLHSAIDAGIALAALDAAVAYARTGARPMPESGVEKSSDDPYVIEAVGRMAVIANSAVAMVGRAANVLNGTAEAFLSGRAGEADLAEASIAVAEAKAASNDASLRVTEMLYEVGSASMSDRALNLDRHWRNARTHTLHDPVAYKYRAIGNYRLNGKLPGVSGKF